jgi:hypothetical protein
MPKSRKRGGEKTHRARVQTRNSKLQNAQNKFNQLLRENMMKQMEEMKQQQVEEPQTDTFSLGEIKQTEQDIY